MPENPDNKDENNEAEAETQNISPITAHLQPWWHGVENGVAKDTDTSTAPQSGLNGNNINVQEVKHVETNSPMELVGHSIVLTSYPYQDPHYAGLMAHGTQAHPHFLGIHQTRMPLPLQMEDEPVYVNAKQYHGILRRRQSRAKAESEKKVMKSKKPYLHESRHQHAMRRARGCGGRFLNTKKLDNEITKNPESQRDSKSLFEDVHQTKGSDHEGRSSVFEDVRKTKTSSNGNKNCHYSLSSMYNFR